MPIYMRFDPDDGGEKIEGGVTAEGYEGWMSITSMTFNVSRDASSSEGEATPAAGGAGAASPAPAAAPPPPTAGQHSDEFAQAAVKQIGGSTIYGAAIAASLTGGRFSHSEQTDATMSEIRIGKRLDRSSAALFAWCAKHSEEGEGPDARIIEIAQVAMAADGLNFMEGVIEFRFSGCTPKSLGVTMNDPEGGPTEDLVISATEVTMYFLGSAADGTVEDYYDEATFRADDLSENASQ